MRQWLNTSTSEEKKLLARTVSKRIIYFYQIAKGNRHPSPMLAKALEEATRRITPDRVLTRHDLRPDIWEAA